jgi:murein L,D-transpeptidase YcbB/YkuD
MNGRGNLGAQWDLVERITRILSLIAIPVAIAVVGALIQNSIAKRSVSQQYVQVAVSILTSKEKLDPNLRNWAVDLLDDNSPTPLGATVRQKLKEGSITLPSGPNPLDTANFRLAQRYLKRLGYYRGEETGDYDNALYQAVTQFQKDNNLEVDGYPGGQTNRKMLDKYEEMLKKPGSGP